MWQLLKRAAIPLRVATVMALAYLGYVYLQRHAAERHFAASQPDPAEVSERQKQYDAAYGGSDLKILAFYPRDLAIVEDQSTLLCYGVMNAQSIHIDPPVSGLIYPALNRCLEIAPRHDTRYVLTAEGKDGKTASAEFRLKVLPDVAHAPQITSFEITKHTLERGTNYFYISFAFDNASRVEIDPPVFEPLEDSAPYGNFIVAPDATTTYTLTVTDKKGRKAEKKLTVEVPAKS